MREIAVMILSEFKARIPIIFDDIDIVLESGDFGHIGSDENSHSKVK